MIEESILIAILAAGKSKRFNGAKLLAASGGATLLSLAVEAAVATGYNTVVITGAYHNEMQQALREDVKTVFNPDYESGMASSIRCAVAYAKDKAAHYVLLMTADQPAITTDHLKQLVTSAAESEINIAASGYAGVQGIPAVFHQAHFEHLLNLKGDEGAKYYLKSLGTQISIVPLAGGENDIDTIDELKKLNEV